MHPKKLSRLFLVGCLRSGSLVTAFFEKVIPTFFE